MRYNIVGRRNSIPAWLCLAYDVTKFMCLLAFRRCDLVLLNPSLGRTAILRDSVFLWLAKRFGKRAIVFFHGWDPRHERLIDSQPGGFLQKFHAADAFIVLSEQFRAKLRAWGIRAPVFLSTTKVDDRMISDFDPVRKRRSKTLLFLARLELNKGILISLEAFSRVLENHPEARFLIAGTGSALTAAREQVEGRSIRNVEFLGSLSGEDLIAAFRGADVYVLPTLHEGMPASVLEAMAFGLPVVTRPVGGIADFFQDRRMGYLTESLDPGWFASAIDTLFSDPELMHRMGLYNHAYVRRHFLASKVARQLEDIMAQL